MFHCVITSPRLSQRLLTLSRFTKHKIYVITLISPEIDWVRVNGGSLILLRLQKKKKYIEESHRHTQPATILVHL